MRLTEPIEEIANPALVYMNLAINAMTPRIAQSIIPSIGEAFRGDSLKNPTLFC